VSKATGYPLAKIAARCMLGKTLDEQGVGGERIPPYCSVKEAVFPFIKFPGVDPLLGPEMKSTGEVMGVGASFGEAYAKAQRAAGVKLARSGAVLISIRDADKPKMIPIARDLLAQGYSLVATPGTARSLGEAGLPCESIFKLNQGRPDLVDLIKNGQVHLVVNTTEGRKAVADSFYIRRAALQHQVTYTTTLAGARATGYALGQLDQGGVNGLQELHRQLS
jgi:carbamoyl-phosphate synthase large subunit